MTRPTPVTLSQAALYFAECKAPVGGGYNFATCLDVRGPVTGGRLVTACERLVAATPALRLRFGIDPMLGAVVSWFSPEPPAVSVLDGVPADPALLAREADRASREPFEVDEGPLVRFLVLRHGLRHATIVLITHHLAVDGVAHARLAGRLADAVTGPLLPDAETAYTRLAGHVRAAESTARRTDEAYWFARVPADLLATTRLPCHDGPPSEGHRRTVRLGPANPANPAPGATASVFTTLVAAVHRALPLPGGRTVLCVAASQRRPGSTDRGVVGSFVNEVPLVSDRKPDESVPGIVAREAPGWAEDLRRRNFPFIDLAGRVAGAGTTAPGLDSVMVGYRRTERRVVRRHQDIVCGADLDYRYPRAKTELSVRFFDYADQLECEVQWGGQLTDAAGQDFLDNLCRQWVRDER